MRHSSFHSDLLQKVLTCVYAQPGENFDRYRFPDSPKALEGWGRGWWKALAVRQAAGRGFVRVENGEVDRALESLHLMEPIFESMDWFYAALEDDASRERLVGLMAFRLLGSHRVRLSRNTPEYWAAIRRIEREGMVEARTCPVPVLDGFLNRYDLAPFGFPVRLEAHLLNILNTFALEQYRYNQSGASVQAEAGDVVIDGGGCWGDTALYFAQRAGPEGKVFCFEFAPDNLRILRRNLGANPALGSRVHVVEQALWNESGECLRFDESGPGTALQAGGTGVHQAWTRALDDLVDREELDRVDFVKMDIEGAELSALRGAEKTLRRFRPKLAISLYHQLSDFVEIPRFLSGLGIGYRFFLDHFTIHQEETVLFATAR